jgi:hypothetical protein
MVIASQALTALIPLLLLVSTLAPASRRDVVSQALVRRFELSGNAADAVRQVFAQPAGASSIGVLSVVILVFSGVSLARRMQRMYQDAWRLEAVASVRGSLNTFLGLGALLLEIALLYLARSALRPLPMDLQPAVRPLRCHAGPGRLAAVRVPHHRLCDGGRRGVRSQPGLVRPAGAFVARCFLHQG